MRSANVAYSNVKIALRTRLSVHADYKHTHNYAAQLSLQKDAVCYDATQCAYAGMSISYYTVLSGGVSIVLLCITRPLVGL
jgi:hypothetical protein